MNSIKYSILWNILSTFILNNLIINSAHIPPNSLAIASNEKYIVLNIDSISLGQKVIYNEVVKVLIAPCPKLYKAELKIHE